MAIEDYIPNIFGSTPQAYQGLLTPQQSQALEKRANLAGLLGFAGALAQGMSPQGYQRSALQNILTAAGAGFGGAGQTYEAGIGQLANLQKLQQSQAQIEAVNQVLSDPNVDPQIKALIRINPQEGIKYLMENAPLTRILSKTTPTVAPTVTPAIDPRVEPVVAQPVSLIAPGVRQEALPEGLITSPVQTIIPERTPPKEIPAGESDFQDWQKAVRLEAETKSPEEISNAAQRALAETEAELAKTEIRPEKGVELQAFEPVPVLEYKEPTQVSATVPAPVVAPAPVTPPVAPVAPVATRVSDDLARLNARKKVLLDQNEELSVIPSRRADELIKRNSEQIDTLDKQINRLTVSQFNFQGVEDLVPPQFKSRVANLRQAAESGTITMDQLTQRLQSLEKDAVDFVTKRTDYTNQDRRVAAGMFQGRPIEELQPAELMQLENKLYEMRIAERKAGATNINMPTESERTAGFLTNRVVNSLNQLQTVVGAKPTAASPDFGAEAVKFLTRSEYLKNLANPEARQQVEAAQLEILDAALTLGTGAAYTREQLENYRRSYFPQLGDKPSTVKDKQDRLQSLIESAMIKSGRAAPKMPTGGAAPAFDMDAIQRELDRRKGK